MTADNVIGMGKPTHAMAFSSGAASTKGGGSGRLQFLGPLRRLDGSERWFVTFYPLPEGRRFEEVRNEVTEEYIQAAGTADAMMLDIRKPGGVQWGADWVRYFIGHPVGHGALPDVAISLPKGDEFISGSEVFAADEAADIFLAYYTTGDIPPGYVLRPVEGYTRSGDIIDVGEAR